MEDVFGDLVARGLVQDSTDREALAARLSDGPVTVYFGCDPTADSLHVGNLVGLLVLRRLQAAGHRPIALAGGATGMVGDPGGRSDERNLLDDDTLARNVAGIRSQLERLLDFDGSDGALLVDNSTWTRPLGLLEFLRDVGKHASMNDMLTRESVQARLRGPGLSFTEFSYALLQANDYLWLHEHEGCELQIGGSDQWGNLTAGTALVRKVTGHTVHAFTWPLLLRSDGKKFAKSEGDNPWLAAERTSPYRFYQYWLNVPDADVERFLLQLTLLPVAEAVAIAAEHLADPARRAGQRRLAAEVTTLVHGPDAAASARAASELLFGEVLADESLSAETLEILEDEIDTTALQAERLEGGLPLAELLPELGLVDSRRRAREHLDQGAVYVNKRRVPHAHTAVDLHPTDAQGGRYILIRVGRRNNHLLRVV